MHCAMEFTTGNETREEKKDNHILDMLTNQVKIFWFIKICVICLLNSGRSLLICKKLN